MKKFAAALLSLGLVAGLVGCGGGGNNSKSGSAVSESKSTIEESKVESSTADSSDIKLGLCLPTRDQYWTTFELGATDAAKAVGIETQVVECKDDISTQLSQIETFSNNGFDAVVVGLSSNESYQEAIDAAGDMKLIFFNRMVTDTACLDGKQTIYVGMAEYDAGYAQGEWLADYFKDSGKTELNGMMFMGILGHQTATDRTQGAKDALEKAGYKVNWVFEDTAEWDRTKALDKFTQFVGTGKEFDFVCANNDEMALGAIEGAKASGIEINFPIVGIDATEIGCQAIVDGTLKMTVNQNPILQGQVVIDYIQDLVAGKTPEGGDDSFVYTTEAQPVTIDNVKEAQAAFEK